MLKINLKIVPMVFGILGCTTNISLDNPGSYREVAYSQRFKFPCYYAIDPSLEKSFIEDGTYRVAIGPAMAAQLQTALLGLCRGSGKLADEQEFKKIAQNRPAVLFNVAAKASMDAKINTWAVNTGKVEGIARIRGKSDADTVSVEFSGRGKKRQYYAEFGSGAEGLRRALTAAIQDLIDNTLERSSDVQKIAAGEKPQ